MSPVNKKVIRVACYIRVSTQEQKLHGLSLDAQRDTLRRYAEEHDLNIIEWYEDEGVSGRKLIRRRPALQRMLNDAQKGLFDRIIFIKLDRYFRSVAEYYECQKILEANHVTWTATEEKYDLATANGRYWVTQKLAMAEYEADQTGERINLVNEYKIRTGQPLTGAHRQGLAYTVIKDEETGLKKVVPDPETKEIVMDYINHFLVHHNKMQAYMYVREKHNVDISYPTFARVLEDTKIYGYYRGNPTYCEAIIDEADWNKIQLILKNGEVKRNKSNRVYLFSGLIPCPKCGRKMAATYYDGSLRKRNGKVYRYHKDYIYYRCNTHGAAHKCTYKSRASEESIETMLLERFNMFMDVYVSNVKAEEARVKNTQAAELVKNIKSEMTRLNNMYRKGRIQDAEYDRDYEALEVRLKGAESALEPLEKRDLAIYEKLIKSDWKELYNALTKENKRAFWRMYIKAIILDDKGVLKDVIFF